MASLLETKSRIKSVETTKKITRAMQLVATAKLSRAISTLEEVKVFYTNVYDTMNRLLASVDDLSFLKHKSPQNRTLHIVINSTLGLCGAYNSNIRKKLNESIKEDDKLIIVGIKGYNQWKGTHKDNIVMTILDFDDNADYGVSQKIGRKAVELFNAGEVNKIFITYTKFINSVSSEATTLQLLPVEREHLNPSQKGYISADTNFEPDLFSILKNAVPLYINSIIFGASNESKVSEHAARRNAMETATDNAEDLKQKLLLDFNRARQAKITEEISEIVAGADAT